MGCDTSDSSLSIAPKRQTNSLKGQVSEQLLSGCVTLSNFPLAVSQLNELSSLNLTTIRELSLQRCRINFECAQKLVNLVIPNLRSLNLNENEMGLIGCRVLFGSKLAANLTYLSLSNNRVGDEALSNYQEIPTLEDLFLNGNGITAAGIALLKGKVPKLECLSLSKNKLDNSVVTALRGLKAQLIFLRLTGNALTDDGVQEALTLPGLDVLIADRNRVSKKKTEFQTQHKYLLV